MANANSFPSFPRPSAGLRRGFPAEIAPILPAVRAFGPKLALLRRSEVWSLVSAGLKSRIPRITIRTPSGRIFPQVLGGVFAFQRRRDICERIRGRYRIEGGPP